MSEKVDLLAGRIKNVVDRFHDVADEYAVVGTAALALWDLRWFDDKKPAVLWATDNYFDEVCHYERYQKAHRGRVRYASGREVEYILTPPGWPFSGQGQVIVQRNSDFMGRRMEMIEGIRVLHFDVMDSIHEHFFNGYATFDDELKDFAQKEARDVFDVLPDATPGELLFARQVSGFDHYYKYTDDGVVYRGAQKRLDDINARVKADLRAKAIYDACWRPPVQKKEGAA